MKNQEERKFNLIVLLKRCLLRWRLILTVALICGLLGGVSNYLNQREYINSFNADNIENESETITSESISSNISDMLSNAIENHSFHIANSKMKELDSGGYTAIGQITGNVDLELKETFAEDNPKTEEFADDIYKELFAIIDAKTSFDELKKNLDITDSYSLRELISVLPFPNGIMIHAVYPDAAGAEKIVRYFMDEISKSPECISLITNQAQVKATYIGAEPLSFETYNNWVIDNIEDMNNLLNMQTNSENISKNIGQYLVHDKPQKESGISLKEVIKNTILYAILGCFISIFIISARLVYSGTVIDSSELDTMYGIKTIVRIQKEEKSKNKIDKAVKKLIHSSCCDSLDNQLLLLIDDLNYNDKDHKSIAVITDSTDETIIQRLSKLDLVNEYCLVTEMGKNLEGRNIISTCRYALIISEIEKTKIQDVDDLVNYLNKRSIDILGCIQLD